FLRTGRRILPDRSAPTVFVAQALAERLVGDACLRLALELRFEQFARCAEFAAQLEEALPAFAVQLACLKRGAHRTAGFVAVRAVAEAALQRERFDVGEAGGGHVF